MSKYFLLLICALLPGIALSATDIAGMRMWTAPDHTRLVFDISSPVKHKLFRLHDPERPGHRLQTIGDESPAGR